MRKIYENVFGVVQSGMHPREVGVAVFLGTLAGFVTGVNLTLAVVLVLALVLAHPLKVFLRTWGLAVTLAWMLTPLTYRLGVYLLQDSEVGQAIAPHAYSVWVALFDLDRFTLIGGLAVGSLLAVLTGGLAAWTTRALQSRYTLLMDRFVNHDRRIVRLGIRLACLMIFGSGLRPMPLRAQARSLRLWGVGVASLVLAPTVVGVWYYTPQWVRGGVLSGISAANQAEVEASQVQLSLSDGRLYIEDLHVPNAADLHRDRLVLGRVMAEVKPGPLLRGRVLIDRILIDGIDTNLARGTPALPYKLHIPGFDGGDNSADETAAEEGPAFDFDLEQYAQDWPRIRERLEQLQELLREIEKVAAQRDNPGADQNTADPFRVPESYRQMRAARYDFGQPQPRFLVQALRVKNPTTKWGLGENAELEITHLSSNAPLVGQPTRVKFAAPQHGILLATSLNYHEPGAQHGLTLEVKQVELPKLLSLDKLDDRFALTGGTLSFTAAGNFYRDRLNLPLHVAADDLKFQLQGEEKFAGLSPQLWNEGLQKLGGFDFDGLVGGRLLRPQLKLDTAGLAHRFRNQLHAAGHLVLVAAIDKEMNRGRVRLDSAIAAGAAEAHEAIGQVAAGANQAMDLAQDRVHETQQQGEAKLEQTAEKVDQVQTQSRQLTAQTASQANTQIAEGQQQADAWMQQQTARYNPLQGMPAPGANLAQGLLTRTAQGLQNGVQTKQQQTDQAVASGADRSRETLGSGKNLLQQGGDQANEQLDRSRGAVANAEMTATGVVASGQGRVETAADGATQGVHASVQRLAPAPAANAANVAAESQGLAEGGSAGVPDTSAAADVVVVEYPDDRPAAVTTNPAANTTAANATVVPAVDLAAQRRSTPLASSGGSAVATNSKGSAGDRYAGAMFNANPYGEADGPPNFTTGPESRPLAETASAPPSETQPLAGKPNRHGTSVAQAAPISNATAAKPAAGEYRSSYDPLYQEDAAARPAAKRSTAATNRYYPVRSQTSPAAAGAVTIPEVAAAETAPPVKKAGDVPQVYGMEPGQRYGTMYAADSSVETKGANPSPPSSAADRRWSNVPVGDPGQSMFPPREMPEVNPPRPRDTAARDFNPYADNSPAEAEARVSSPMVNTMAGAAAPAPEESAFRRTVKRIWPFRGSSESSAKPAGDQPAAEVAQLPPPRGSFEPANSLPADSVSPPAVEKKPWYRRLW